MRAVADSGGEPGVHSDLASRSSWFEADLKFQQHLTISFLSEALAWCSDGSE
jgi:hypothetical protein